MSDAMRRVIISMGLSPTDFIVYHIALGVGYGWMEMG